MTRIDPGGSGRIDVLAIDGGGVRGIMPARLLTSLERSLGGFLRDHFSVFTGTSTGGILAAAFAQQGTPVKASTIVDVYRSASIALFPKPSGTPSKLTPNRPPSRRGMSQFLEYVGDGELAGSDREVAMPTFDLEEGRSFLLTREEARRGSESISLADAVMATTAAPTYLPPVAAQWQGRDRTLVDGGIFAPNPSLLTAVALRSASPRRRIRLLSIDCGTGGPEEAGGRLKSQLFGSPSDRTNLGWAKRYLKTTMVALTDSADLLTAQLLGRDYLRVRIPYDGREIGLDHADEATMERMLDAAEKSWRTQRKRILEFLR